MVDEHGNLFPKLHENEDGAATYSEVLNYLVKMTEHERGGINHNHPLRNALLCFQSVF